MAWEVGYRQLLRAGELARRIEAAYALLESCRVCPRACGVDRLAGQTGDCHTGREAVVCSAHPHHGEEAPLVGVGGSGTIFMAWCNLQCCYCQNAEISQGGEGRPMTPEQIAGLMLALAERGCHNINIVSPTHVVPQMLAALAIAAQAGLTLPLVYNTGGYDSLETLRLLDGVVDIYMPDMKYADAAIGQALSGVPDYPAVNQAAVREMHRQVGDLVLDERRIARRGLLVRHLVLPDNRAGSAAIFRFLAQDISTNTYLNVMDQYRPCYQAPARPPLDRRITRAEYRQAADAALAAGLHRLDDRRRF
ncbi:MAG: radical SAM protein [Chloroflexi bacterium]|nr:radical SAM protein [Chloroflexota bacterium]MBU1750114.1 radical SAM protein [Chloroflexota bacterium]